MTTTTPSGIVYDTDDAPLRFYGHEADPAERQAITTILEDYYAAAAKNNGAQACKLLSSLTVETIPEDYGELPGLRGKTCATVMSKFFMQNHAEVAKDSAAFAVVSIRIEGVTALALLRFAHASEPDHIQLRREAGIWKVWELLAGHMP